MASIAVIYWSGTGNTESMANAIAKGAGAQAIPVSNITAADALQYDKLALGCPSMGDEVLEESEFEPFFAEIESSLGGKKLALFGSYGWGDGQWMRDWHERAEKTGAVLASDLIQQEEELDMDVCEQYGKAFAAL